MPPLPTTPDDLYPSIKRRLNDIESFQIPRLTKCTGPIGLQRELAEETKGDLEQVRLSVEVRLVLFSCFPLLFPYNLFID
jgi:protein transport protein SEC20